MEASDDRFERWEVIDMLARAYIETGQIASAKTLLTDLINRFPGYDPGRMLLATVLACLLTGALASIEVYAAQLVWPALQFPDVDTAYVFVAGRAGGN